MMQEINGHIGFDSWVWEESMQGFFSPIPYPEDGKDYDWDEDTVSWIEIPVEQGDE